VPALSRVVLAWPMRLAYLIAGWPGRWCARLFRCTRGRRAGCGRRFSHGPRFRAITLPAGHGLLEPFHPRRGGLDSKPRQSHKLIHRLRNEIAGGFTLVGLAASLFAVVVHFSGPHCGHLNAVAISTRLLRVTPRLGHGSRERRLPATGPGTRLPRSRLIALYPAMIS